MPNTSKPLLEICELSVWRGELLLLDDVNFSVDAGEVVQIQGTNGSGKTTLLRILCGLGTADEGEVYWRGLPLHRCREQFNAALLYLGHKAGIKGDLSPAENLILFSKLNVAVNHDNNEKGEPSASWLESAIDNVLEQHGLLSRKHIPCAKLSAGQQRRVALSRLVLEQAKLWVLDEPLTALDSFGLKWVGEQIRRHVEGGGAVIFTTHNPLEIEGVQIRPLLLESST